MARDLHRSEIQNSFNITKRSYIRFSYRTFHVLDSMQMVKFMLIFKLTCIELGSFAKFDVLNRAYLFSYLNSNLSPSSYFNFSNFRA